MSQVDEYAKSTSWISCIKPNPQAQMRLICLPYAGGNSSMFRTWLTGIPSSTELLVIQLPGRERRLSEPPLRYFKDIINILCPLILPYLDLPYVLFGHSMGAMLGFELARELFGKAPSPLALLISARRAPHIQIEDKSFRQLTNAEFLRKFRHIGGTSDAIIENDELMQLLLPSLWADFEVCETYHYFPSPPLDCPITVIGGEQDSSIRREFLESWRIYTTREFRMHILPGDHFYLNEYRSQFLHIVSKELQYYAKLG